MTDFRSMYDKEYIGAWDITNGDWTITITRVQAGELHNPGTKKKTKKPVVYFKESDKGFCLNATNGKTIAGLYGVHVENWTGKRITVYKSTTRDPNGGGECECLRVRPKVPAGHDTERATGGAQPGLPSSLPGSAASAPTHDWDAELSAAQTLGELAAVWKRVPEKPKHEAAKDKRKAELTPRPTEDDFVREMNEAERN